ncbi:MAG: hypothetical protein KatS3mg121_1060 [Gammaproteobacteria bacterium]|nr:MAG: hypothetical protein KatS3mg121_1060 [Gammaproteobacteria bacterium]
MFEKRGVLLLSAALSATVAAAETLVDPMRPDGAAAPSAAGAAALRLQAVLVSPGRRLAVINGRVLREGERIAGARLLRIAERAVELERGGRRIVLRTVESVRR